MEFKRSTFPRGYRLTFELTAPDDVTPILRCRVRRRSEASTAISPSTSSLKIGSGRGEQRGNARTKRETPTCACQCHCQKRDSRGTQSSTVPKGPLSIQQFREQTASNSLYYQFSKFIGHVLAFMRKEFNSIWSLNVIILSHIYTLLYVFLYLWMVCAFYIYG